MSERVEADQIAERILAEPPESGGSRPVRGAQSCVAQGRGVRQEYSGETAMTSEADLKRLADLARRHMDCPPPSWLRCLINAYDQEHDWDADEDSDATQEMLQECRALADAIERFWESPPVPSEPDDDMPF